MVLLSWLNRFIILCFHPCLELLNGFIILGMCNLLSDHTGYIDHRERSEERDRKCYQYLAPHFAGKCRIVGFVKLLHDRRFKCSLVLGSKKFSVVKVDGIEPSTTDF